MANIETKLLNQVFNKMKNLSLEQFDYYYQQFLELNADEEMTDAIKYQATILEGKFLAYDEIYAHLKRMHQQMLSENR